MPVLYGGTGVVASLGALTSTTVELQAGQCWTIPSGRFAVRTGKFTTIQERDPITSIWRKVGGGGTGGGNEVYTSDGQNFRLANQTGCAVGAQTNTGGAGTGYTAVPVVAASAGGSIWGAIVGGAISTTVTVSNGGSNYTYPPAVILGPPPGPGVNPLAPNGGVPASAYCTLSGGAVSTITVIDQGAGYQLPPTVTFVNDPREGVNGVTAGFGATAITSLTGAGTITAIVCLDHGTPLTAIPTLTLTGGGGSGVTTTVIMCWTITAYATSLTTAGSGYVAPVLISGYGGYTATASAYLNPTIQSNLVAGRAALIVGAISGFTLTTAGQSVQDGGIYPGFPTMYVAAAGPAAAIASSSPVTFINSAMGGVNDVSLIWPT